MNADYVENIIRNIDKQSYKCILVDGAWGIGKSYMVRKALEDMKDRTDGGRYIYVFSLSGEPIRKYVLDHNVYGISVDELNGEIVATDVNSDEPVVKYAVD